MASSGTPSSPRHVGLVVDPLVREDGGVDPEVHLADAGDAPSRIDASPGEAQPPAIADQSAFVTTGSAEPVPRQADGPAHSIRERLLQRAASVGRGPIAHGASGLDELVHADPKPSTPLDAELDRIASHGQRPPVVPLVRRVGGHLSPKQIALFGTLMGLATVATLIALAIQFDPSLALPLPASSARVAPTASAEPVHTITRKPRKKVVGPWRIRDMAGDSGLRVIKGKIGREPFLRAIQEAGVPKKQAYRVLIAFKGQRDFDKCASSDAFIALLDRSSKRLKAFEYVVSMEEVYQAREGADGLLKGKRLDLKVEREQVSGAVAMNGDDLAAAAKTSGFDTSLPTALRQALNGHLTLEEIGRGAILRVVAQEVTVLGEFSRYAGIEALEVRGAEGKGSVLRVYYFRGKESRGHFDAKGRAPYEGGWRKPIPGAPVTSRFDLKRMHPVLKKVMPHYGVDYGAPAGEPVGAASYGTVSFVGYSGPAGNLVKVEHPGGVETGYAHLSRFADGLQVGDKVKRLQTVGYVGSTGRSTGPHLHFMAKRDGKFIDPESLNLDSMRVLPKEERAAFAQLKAKYDAALDAIALPRIAPPDEAIAAASAASAASATEQGVGEEYDADENRAGEAAGSSRTEPAEPAKPPPAAPATKSGSALYLTDKELLEMQGASDDGEVAE